MSFNGPESRNVNITKDRIGLSLLEIIIALLILSLVMYSLVSLFVVSKRFVYHSGSRSSAMEVAKYALEDEAQILVTADKYLSNQNCLYDSSKCTSFLLTQNGVVYNISYATSNVTNATLLNTTLRKVIINVTWNETAM